MGSVKESTLVVYWDMVWNNTKDALISRGTSENMLTATVAWFKTVSKKHQETTTHFELLRNDISSNQNRASGTPCLVGALESIGPYPAVPLRHRHRRCYAQGAVLHNCCCWESERGPRRWSQWLKPKYSRLKRPQRSERSSHPKFGPAVWKRFQEQHGGTFK